MPTFPAGFAVCVCVRVADAGIVVLSLMKPSGHSPMIHSGLGRSGDVHCATDVAAYHYGISVQDAWQLRDAFLMGRFFMGKMRLEKAYEIAGTPFSKPGIP